jgi:serine/threonine protein kinase
MMEAVRCRSCYRRLLPGAACPRHAGDPAPAERSRSIAPPEVPGLTDLSVLGVGGMAIVFRAMHASGPVAVKVARSTARARLAREATALRRVGPPATPGFVAAGITPSGHPYVIMELLTGQTLAGWMAARPAGGAVSVAEAAPIVNAVAVALDRVHVSGLVHRDLKPENVFLREDGGATLIDFGLSRVVAGTDPPPGGLELTRANQKLGTATYMAPEQVLEARDVDTRADVYSLGVIAYELLTGRPPFIGDPSTVMRAHVKNDPPPPTSFMPLPAAVEAAVLHAIAKDRDARFPDARALASALRSGRVESD